MYPEQRKRYVDNWEDISLAYREQTNWQCEECGIAQSMWRISKAFSRPYKVVIQVAHLNQDPSDNRDENLRSLCQVCHLKYDATENSRKALQTQCRKEYQKQIDAGQLELFPNDDSKGSISA